MRISILLLIVPFCCFSQTETERNKIISTYDQKAVELLKEEAKIYTKQQKDLIKQYKATHDVIESEFHSLQRMHDGTPIFFTTFNDGSSKTIRANSLYPGGALGLNITGAGMIAGVWDGGKVRNTHQEFTNNRVIPSDGATTLSAHATHVTGTVMAAGTNAIRRGIAYGAEVRSYDWDTDYEEMVTFGSLGYLVSNHSYGYNTDNLAVWKFGSYDSSSIEIDEVANTFPYYQVVIAAGNDRANGDLAQAANENGYDLLSGTGCSKNGITVSAAHEILNYVDSFSVQMSDFSNFGPPDDGRIKPDIAAKGTGVDSPVSNNNSSYEVYNGTSMAAPAITGMILLLQKHYNNLNSTYMKAATVRGLVCHTAREAGNYHGPDYEFGWGLADGQSAASIISAKGNTAILEENTLALGQTFTKQISVSSPQSLKATICWTDPVGNQNGNGVNDNRAPRLKNNLDLKILKDGVTYYPWKLDAEEPYMEPTRDSDNNVDNIEKVEIDLAQPGIYTIQVTHKGTALVGGTDSQNFSLIASGSQSISLANNQYELANSIILYPNPTNSILNFATPNNVEVTQVALYDVLGKQVMSNAQVMNNSLDVSGISKGIYLIAFTCDGQSVVKKFVKE